MIACLRLDSQLAPVNICAQAADLVSTSFPIWAFGIHFLSIRCRRIAILAYISLSWGSRLAGPFSLIWGPSKSFLKYDTFSLVNLRIPGPEAPRPIFLNLGCPNPYSNIASRLQSEFQASISASRLQCEPPGSNLSLQASIWASRLQSDPPGFNLSPEASIWASRLQSEPAGFNLSLEASMWASRL
jgi:hypothetical protein